MASWPELRWAIGIAWRVVLDAVLIAAARAPAAAAPGRVCLVRIDGSGDFVLWIEACWALSARYRSAGSRVVLVAQADWAAWARELGVADEVWEFDRARFVSELGYRAQWIRRMRAAGFASVLQPTHSRRPDLGDALVRASGAPRRIGSAGDATNTPAWLKRWADRWYTELLPCGGTDRMELLRNADFMRGLGLKDFRARAPRLGAPLPRNPVSLGRGSYAVLAPGAGLALRAWPLPAFAETGRRLAARGLKLVLAGGAGDRALAQALARELPAPVEDLTGRTTLGELAALFADARLAVTNETGAAHIAAAAGTQVVCVTGGGHYGRFMPYQTEEGGGAAPPPVAVAHRMHCFGCRWWCIYPRGPADPVKCVRDVAPDDLWAQVDACLAQGGAGA